MSVASKNLFELLGNDAEDDTPQAPVKTVEKTTMRSTKRNAEPEAPARAPANTGARRNNTSGNEAAFRDRGAGSDRNRGKATDEAARGGPRGGAGARVRGGRGGRFPRERDDRHTKSQVTGSEKQAAQSWGATEGEAERKDEQAGEAIAQAEKKDADAEAAAPVEPEEPEDKHISYADYLAQQAEKKLALGDSSDTRKPNEGSQLKKEWANAKEVTREETDFMIGTGGKTKRERERKTKNVLEIDQRYVEPERSTRGGARGGRGGPRGGAPRGDRGDRGAPRGGSFRGDRGGDRAPRGDRGAPRGGRREGGAAPINTADQSAFPSLGGN
ncbi:Suppressor protein STM1 [Colletotrichum sidae]|uniref:Suppressor protein STM1 n=3 Tax=Colletotrichum orbiculare species complex TaxID=2707354 RepID=N4UT58_COLOR|nr:Suppressor protein STM1 [Colletotrichum orbiculare MAFF 240422]TDZ36419.1 Suppressor protein STM1 [Colletotrichum spinosum]TEA21143.1 Suppressor protein STM1 [Colletotrichum sidae]